MAGLSPSSLIPVVAGALAAYAWFASPQDVGVLAAAAAAMEEGGPVRVVTVSQPPGTTEPVEIELRADYERDVVVIEAPEEGVERRLVLGGDTYDLLADGTWLHPDDVPPLFGQDIPGQLRAMEGDVREVGPWAYRVRFGLAIARLELDPDGRPVRFESRLDGSELSWEVVGRGLPLSFLRPPQARDVTSAEHQRLVAEAAGS